MDNPILREIRQIREEHAAQFDYDIDAILADNRRPFAGGNHPRVSLVPARTDIPTTRPEVQPATIEE
ncbi:MAG: hypothetical protein FJW40_21325 [Acidobacteria bacterium]|nr:hypothetical protein [Acidobacteriota bacterium]